MNPKLHSAILILALTLVNPVLAENAHIESFKKNLKAELVVKSAIAPEAITISDDGQKLAYIAKLHHDMKSAPPTTAWLTQKKDGVWTEPVQAPWRGMVTSVSFGNRDQWLVVTNSHGTLKGYRTILKNLFGDREQIGNLEHFEHRIEIYDAHKPKRKLFSFNSAEFGLAKPEMLKHARVSPDGQWMTFYTHGYADQIGVYVYNFATRKTVHLGLSDDKHPTWTPDGSKILFHSQTGGNSFNGSGEAEQSLIGYYDFAQMTEANLPARVMVDTNEAGRYVYNKHPMVYPGTDLLFFHSQQGPEEGKKLYVRRLSGNGPVYKIADVLEGDVELKALKHANSSVSPSGVYFVARPKGAPKSENRVIDPYAENPRMTTVYDVKNIYHLSDAEIQKVQRHVK